METSAKRTKQPVLSSRGEDCIVQYERRLRVEEDLSSATIRNHLSDLRQFIAWCESLWQQGREDTQSFAPEAVTSPTLIHYRTTLQTRQFKPNSINRSLISLKRYFAWLMMTGQLTYDPAKVVKLVGEEATFPPPYRVTRPRSLYTHACPGLLGKEKWEHSREWQAKQVP